MVLYNSSAKYVQYVHFVNILLQEMVRTYESTNDKWRAFGYQKAIQVLRKQPKPISTFEVGKSFIFSLL